MDWRRKGDRMVARGVSDAWSVRHLIERLMQRAFQKSVRKL